MKSMIARRLSLAILAIAGIASAQPVPIVYPSKGQTPQQQQKDDGECYVWARTNTGVDPAAMASAAAPAPATPGAPPVVGGAARGAVGGTVIGAIAGNAGKGAAIGAAAGGMAGGARARQGQHQQQQQQAAAQAQRKTAMDNFNRAKSACMEGRGYTIK